MAAGRDDTTGSIKQFALKRQYQGLEVCFCASESPGLAFSTTYLRESSVPSGGAAVSPTDKP
jgi:hypothetical protein